MTNEEAIRIIKIVLAVAEDFKITVQGEEFTEEKCKEAVEIATEALSSSGKPNKWIPVSERLPEKDKDYLCCDDMGQMDVGYFSQTCWCCNAYMYDVIAWMPLPEPYKAESEDKE